MAESKATFPAPLVDLSYCGDYLASNIATGYVSASL
jgi:hypothetical protein